MLVGLQVDKKYPSKATKSVQLAAENSRVCLVVEAHDMLKAALQHGVRVWRHPEAESGPVNHMAALRFEVLELKEAVTSGFEALENKPVKDTAETAPVLDEARMIQTIVTKTKECITKVRLNPAGSACDHALTCSAVFLCHTQNP